MRNLKAHTVAPERQSLRHANVGWEVGDTTDYRAREWVRQSRDPGQNQVPTPQRNLVDAYRKH